MSSPVPPSSLSLSVLKTRLWDCAEILRGSAVDRTDWKAYILPLLFFKRICDVWDEETAEARDVRRVEPVDFPEDHRFQVPEGCHWRDVREAPDERRHGPRARHARDRAAPTPTRSTASSATPTGGTRRSSPTRLLKDLIEGLLGGLARQRAPSPPTSSATPTST